jgi:hypothetical protein
VLIASLHRTQEVGGSNPPSSIEEEALQWGIRPMRLRIGHRATYRSLSGTVATFRTKESCHEKESLPCRIIGFGLRWP